MFVNRQPLRSGTADDPPPPPAPRARMAHTLPDTIAAAMSGGRFPADFPAAASSANRAGSTPSPGHHTKKHSTAQHSTAQHSTAQHNTAQHSTARHNTAQHSTAIYAQSRQLGRHKCHTSPILQLHPPWLPHLPDSAHPLVVAAPPPPLRVGPRPFTPAPQPGWASWHAYGSQGAHGLC
jgi:hypothetical protein